MPLIQTVEELLAASGADLGVSEWYEVTQARVNAFAEDTGDLQPIHIDPQRAVEAGLEGTIAHGFFTLSLVPLLAKTLDGAKLTVPKRMAINYGLNKVRFISPVKIPARIRLRTQLGEVTTTGLSSVQLVFRHTIEIEGEVRPAMYAEAIDRFFF
jgi:acyl dehydratase